MSTTSSERPAYPPSRSTTSSAADCCPRRSPPAACAASRQSSRRSASGPEPASKVFAIASVATSRALAIRELGEVEVEELTPRFGDEDGGDLGAGEGCLDLFGRLRADDDRPPLLVRGFEGGIVGDVVQHQRVVGLELALDRDLRDAAAGGSEPAFSQTVAVSPGSSASTSTPGACCRSSSGVPASSGNVP